MGDVMSIPHMSGWLVVSLILFAIQYLTMPADPMDASRWARALVVVNKLNLLTVGGWLGYLLDVRLFPYARPDAILRKIAGPDARPDQHAAVMACFQMAMLRRAIIVAATVLAVALGA